MHGKTKEQYMIRKLLVVVAAIAIPVGGLAGIAGASSPHTNAYTSDKVSCTKISGTISFSIPLTSGGFTSGSHTQKTTISASESGCTVKTIAGGAVATGVSGKVSGTLTQTSTGSVSKPADSCGGLAGVSPESGAFTVAWKKGSAAEGTTTLTLKGDTGAAATSGPAKGHATFTVNLKSVAGDFSSKGTTGAKVEAETAKTTVQILTACGKTAATGIKSLGIQNIPGTPITVG
jgi:hypothetical protein